MAGIKLASVSASSLSALETAGQKLNEDDEPEGAMIFAFNDSGTGGYGYDYEGKTVDVLKWTKYTISYNASTGLLAIPDSTDDDTAIYLVKVGSGFAVCPVAEDSIAGTSLSEVFEDSGLTYSDGKLYSSGIQIGTCSESGNIATIVITNYSTSYLAKINGNYYYCIEIYKYSGSLPSVN